MVDRKLIAVFTVAIQLAAFVLGDSSSSATRHTSKSLSSSKLKKVADMSDMNQFKELLRPFMRERVSDTDGNRIAQKHIADTLNGLGWSVSEDSFEAPTPLGQKRFTNIVATLYPNLPFRLTLACHHDSKYFARSTFIGATDSAVPCAMLLDLAKHLNTYLSNGGGGKRKDISLQLIFFDGEEAFVSWSESDSLYGARHLANRMSLTKMERDGDRTELDAMDALVLLDLIGTKDVEFKSFFPITEHLFERLQRIEKNLRKQNLLDLTERQGIDYFKTPQFIGNEGIQDDHIPFLRKGVPILHLISWPFPTVWHTASDDESSLHYPTIDNLNKVFRIFVAEYLHLSI